MDESHEQDGSGGCQCELEIRQNAWTVPRARCEDGMQCHPQELNLGAQRREPTGLEVTSMARVVFGAV